MKIYIFKIMYWNMVKEKKKNIDIKVKTKTEISLLNN